MFGLLHDGGMLVFVDGHSVGGPQDLVVLAGCHGLDLLYIVAFELPVAQGLVLPLGRSLKNLDPFPDDMLLQLGPHATIAEAIVVLLQLLPLAAELAEELCEALPVAELFGTDAVTFEGNLRVVARLAAPTAVGIRDPRKLVALRALELRFAKPAHTLQRSRRHHRWRRSFGTRLLRHQLLLLLLSRPLRGGLGSRNLLAGVSLHSLRCSCHVLRSKRKAAGPTQEAA